MDIGPHWTSLENPDIIRLKLVGVVSLEHAQEVNQAHRDFAQGLPHFFYLIDLSELDSIPAAVRKEAAGTLKDLPLYGTAIYGASLAARVVAKLLLTAVNLVRADRKNPVQFFETEGEARVWIDGRRELVVSDRI
ncbi:MAG TPA: hypothetical protein VJ725_28070 [Thermoanaerobaculia bacterium]|nr:hypothetical protein [Thermoanaerobaculia bacterium]